MFAPKGVVGLWNDWIASIVERGQAPSGAVALRTEP
jgi:hypothetical protein